MRRLPATAALSVAVVLAGCQPAAEAPPELPPYDAAAHRANVEEWRAWRHSELVKPDGWLSLSGLYWLLPGEYTFGSAPDNDLVYAREGVPAMLGSFHVTETQVEFYPEQDVGTTLPDGDGGFSGALVYDAGIEGERPIMQWGDMQWYVIEREDHLALRLKDGASELIGGFEGIDNFELAAQWRLDATFEYLDPPGTIKVPNVFGSLGDEELLGAVVFEYGGETYQLDMWRDSGDPDNLFTAFGDETNAESSYGAGRFLWVDAPDEWGRTVIDFNRSYNPPCAFSPFATCPLPPPQNRLPLKIEAGERAFSKKVARPVGPPGNEN